MTARPILFSGPMIRALLDGRKTQTRRISKQHQGGGKRYFDRANPSIPRLDFTCPYGNSGDSLWVRETYALEHCVEGGPPFSDGRPIKHRAEDDVDGALPLWVQPHYRATDPTPDLAYDDVDEAICRWRPSIHMPRWASRLTLELTEVRVERLQDISEEAAKQEGASAAFGMTAPDSRNNRHAGHSYMLGFKELWESIHGKDSWNENPHLWVLRFNVHRCNIDAYLKGLAA